MGSDKMRHPKKDAFLKAYAKCGNVSEAARIAGVARQTHYQWLNEDGKYPDRFESAHGEFCDLLESECRRRAVEGVEKPVGWFRGEAGGTVREYSDTLLIFYMKGAMPEKYRERIDTTVSLDANETAEVLEDTDWYGTRSRLPATAFDAPDGDSGGPGPVQGGSEWPPGGQNGNGANGNGKGPRT